MRSLFQQRNYLLAINFTCAPPRHPLQHGVYSLLLICICPVRTYSTNTADVELFRNTSLFITKLVINILKTWLLICCIWPRPSSRAITQRQSGLPSAAVQQVFFVELRQSNAMLRPQPFDVHSGGLCTSLWSERLLERLSLRLSAIRQLLSSRWLQWEMFFLRYRIHVPFGGCLICTASKLLIRR